MIGMNDKQIKSVSKQTLERMPYYIQCLKELKHNNVELVAAPLIAKTLNLNEVQVRKDLSAVSSKSGKPRLGFKVTELLYDMEHFLGYHNINDAVLVGVGHLGKSLLSYKGFSNFGMNIVATFDNNPEVIGTNICGKEVISVEKLGQLCKRMGILIGIITVPAESAQQVCNILVENGVLAIWNFAPIHIKTPENILVQNENMAVSLTVLSKHLEEQLKTDKYQID